mgnify:CR=1 FL=1
MYAIIEQGGKQHKVSEGDVLNIELTDVDKDAGSIEMDKVLFVGLDEGEPKIGTPYVEGAKVTASFESSAADAVVKGPKLYPTYRRRRKSSMTRKGHRQKYLKVKIDKIEA